MKKLITYAAVVTAAISGGLYFKDEVKTDQVNEISKNTKQSESYLNFTHNDVARAEIVSMGSSLELLVYANPDIAYVAIKEAANAIRNLEKTITSWKPNSDVYYLNANSGSPVQVSEVTFNLIEKAIYESKVTSGAFDITVGAVWDLYPFRDKNKAMPNDDQIEEAMKFVGSDKIILDRDSHTITLPKGMRINLGAIGKGEAVNVALGVFKKYGIKNAAVSAGGDLTAIGSKGDAPWIVDLENPSWKGKKLMRIELQNESVATSGNAERFFYHEGKLHGHIIDPRTGKDVTHLQSATVITKDPTLADVYATTVFVLGLDAGLAWAEAQQDVKAIVVDSNGDVHMTKNMKEQSFE